MLILLFLLSLAVADSIAWSVPVEQGETVEIELWCKDTMVLRLFSQDNVQASSTFWMSDLDEQLGVVSGSIPDAWLASGPWSLKVYAGDELREEQVLQTTQQAPKVVMVSLTDDSTGVLAYRKDRSDLVGFAYTETVNQSAFLPLSTNSDWVALPVGGQRYSPEKPRESMLQFRATANSSITSRQMDARYNWIIRLLLLPCSVILIGLGGYGLRQSLRRRENLIFLGLCCLLGLWVIRSVLFEMGSGILMGEIDYNDPPTSVSLLASIAQSLPVGSEISTLYNFPEGHSWMILGPNWLSYVLVAPIAWFSNAIVAQNLGIALACALNAYCSWLLGRSLGLGKIAAGVASLGIVCAPVLLNEIDKLSLDRSFLFPIPLFFLFVHQSFQIEGHERWKYVLGAGVSLAACFYCQVYYGLYLLAALPFLLVVRLFRRFRDSLLVCLALTGLSLVLMAPGLFLLKDTTSGTVYDGSQNIETPLNIARPFTAEEVSRYLNKYDPRAGDAAMHKDMSSAQNRLMAVISNSIPVEQILFPTQLVMGSGLYWFFLPLVLWLTPNRKRTLLVYWEVGVLAVLALGPFMKFEDSFAMNPLPYYLPHLIIPSFDQLKHPDRYAMLLICISSIPLGFLLQGVFERTTSWKWLLWPPTILSALFLWLFLRPVSSQHENPYFVYNLNRIGTPWFTVKRWFDVKVDTVSVKWMKQPAKWPIPKRESLEPIYGGTAMFLPVKSNMLVVPHLQALQANLKVVNDPPHGVDPKRQISGWAENNALLNQLLWSSGSDRLNTLIPSVVSQTDLLDLQQHQLRYIVLFESELHSVRRVTDTRALLARHAELVQEEAGLSVWQLNAP